MSLTIKNPHVDVLVTELAQLTNDTKTGAIERALCDRLARVRLRGTAVKRAARVLLFLKREVWPRVPPERLGHPPDRQEIARFLGYGHTAR